MIGGICTRCGIGSFGGGGFDSCSTCPTRMTTAFIGSTHLGNCTCPIGYVGEDGVGCSPCVQNTYKDILGSSTCVACPQNSTSPSASSSLSQCVCVSGFAGTFGTNCSICDVGTWSAGGTQLECSLCPAGRFGSTNGLTSSTCSGICSANYYCPAGSTSATDKQCQANANSTAGSTQLANCICNSYVNSLGRHPVRITNQMSWVCCLFCIDYSGYSGPDGGSCVICGAGTYSVVGGSAACISCAQGRYGSSSGLTNALCDGICPVTPKVTHFSLISVHQKAQ
jgi:hypothetical protein